MEKWNAHTRTRHDLYGFIDILAVNERVTLGVQATSTSNIRSRVRKIQNECEHVSSWLECEHRLLWVVGWRKYKKPKDGKWWRPTVLEVTMQGVQHGEGDTD